MGRHGCARLCHAGPPENGGAAPPCAGARAIGARPWRPRRVWWRCEHELRRAVVLGDSTSSMGAPRPIRNGEGRNRQLACEPQQHNKGARVAGPAFVPRLACQGPARTRGPRGGKRRGPKPRRCSLSRVHRQGRRRLPVAAFNTGMLSLDGMRSRPLSTARSARARPGRRRRGRAHRYLLPAQRAFLRTPRTRARASQRGRRGSTTATLTRRPRRLAAARAVPRHRQSSLSATRRPAASPAARSNQSAGSLPSRRPQPATFRASFGARSRCSACLCALRCGGVWRPAGRAAPPAWARTAPALPLLRRATRSLLGSTRPGRG